MSTALTSSRPAPANAREAQAQSRGLMSGSGASEQPDYRFDIEGLRGVAVLSLLAVHLFPQWAKAGFIGADIFFVISGFLLTRSLLKSHDARSLSIGGFYATRLRRIVPSLGTVLLLTLVFSVLFTYPSAAREIAASVVNGSLFISNIMLWQDALQLSRPVDMGPLAHLWWLGVEAQFCVVWPVVVALVLRRGRWKLEVIAALVVLSFSLNVLLAASTASPHLLLPFTRLWEPMLGGLLALVMHDSGKQRWAEALYSQRASDTLGYAGAVLLAAAVLLTDRATHLPASWALLITMGTLALLAAGPLAWVNRVVLSNSVLRFYGAISFPLYLWHWPLLCFPAVLGIPMSHELRVIILTASVVLASLTHELVDRRAQKGAHQRGLPLSALAWLAALALCGWYVVTTDGLMASFPQDMQRAPF